ncbi:MAG: hypothetical protein MCSN_4810 [Candidatus Microsyncoccus archaeolyticus]|nr:MAG: hypothetical protein MCSN_4810 [Candidatus Parcubacteria bacterium]
MDNTVGSLTQLQESLIIGSILGDGYVRIIPGRKDAFLEINHSIKAKEYVDWKYSVLKNICKSEPKERNTNDGRVAYRFFTKQNCEITNLLNLFYENGKKIIPVNLELNPIILAVWFMDDGSKSKSSVYLNTQQFGLIDQNRLLHKLRQFGLKARLNRDKKYYRIRFLSESIFKLNQIIDPYVISSMRYKLSYDPVET